MSWRFFRRVAGMRQGTLWRPASSTAKFDLRHRPRTHGFDDTLEELLRGGVRDREHAVNEAPGPFRDVHAAARLGERMFGILCRCRGPQRGSHSPTPACFGVRLAHRLERVLPRSDESGQALLGDFDCPSVDVRADEIAPTEQGGDP